MSLHPDFPGDDSRADAFYGFVVGEAGYVQMAIYFDSEDDSDVARRIWLGVERGTAD